MLKELLLAMFLIFSNLVRMNSNKVQQFIVICFVLNIMLIKSNTKQKIKFRRA